MQALMLVFLMYVSKVDDLLVIILVIMSIFISLDLMVFGRLVDED